MDASGNLYGTTAFGGSANSSGVAFELTPNQAHTAWRETVLHAFCSGGGTCADGSGPNGDSSQAALIFDSAGTLYGTTANGGGTGCKFASKVIGCGTVFELSGAGTPLSENPQTSDFNAAGKSDILWQNTNGQADIWLMNGTTPTKEAVVGANPGPSWRVIGTGDFYGSLYSDILWQNLSGAVAIWEMNGAKVIASPVIGNPGPSWHVIGSGDFNGDGKSDILWQNANGAVAIWEMNGAKVIASPVIGNPGISWHAIGE